MDEDVADWKDIYKAGSVKREISSQGEKTAGTVLGFGHLLSNQNIFFCVLTFLLLHFRGKNPQGQYH